MFMKDNIFSRIIIAIIVVVILSALIVPVFKLIGFPLSDDLVKVIRLCIAGIAALYVWRGTKDLTA